MNDEERYAAEMARMDRAMKGGAARPVFQANKPQAQPVVQPQNNLVSPRYQQKAAGNFFVYHFNLF